MSHSGEADEHESKVILNQGINIIDEHSMESDEDQRVVDHLSPQTLLETPNDNEVQYSFRSPEGMFKSYYCNCIYLKGFFFRYDNIQSASSRRRC